MKTVQHEAFRLIGIKTRTSNPEEIQGAGRIAVLWERFYSENVTQQISQKISNQIFGVYYEYEGNEHAPYSLLVGMKVPPGTTAPQGLEMIDIPEQTYTRFTTEKGPRPFIIYEAWKNIWSLTEKSQLKRKYTYDFELYDERSQDPQSAQLDIYIAI